MLRETLIGQKNELKNLLNKAFIERQATKNVKKFVANDLVKVILGPRRAGKSIFSAHLFGVHHPAYANFDDENLVKVKNYDDITRELHAIYGNKKVFLFDEIQNLPNWELFINRLHRQGYNIMLTGSNAKLLSKELSTSLTGRHIPIEILPFNFQEFLTAKKFIFEKEEISIPEIKGRLLGLLQEYMINGGFPELTVKELEPKGYLDTLLNSQIFTDIVKRYKLRLSQKIYDLEIFLLNNFASEFSYRKLSNQLGFSSVATLEKFLGYLQEAYLLYVLERYSHKAGERLNFPKKAYLVDNGFITAKAVQMSENNGKLMENLVFSELLKRGYKPNQNLFYYKTKNNKEIDFVLRSALTTKSLIQVAYHVDKMGVKDRETNALVAASVELKCNDLTVLTWDYEKNETFKGKKIKFIPLWKWLLNLK
ncbi:MAG: hypothetical protein ACD_7C00266G0011 [uncultured bacterium]|nr:MAG: hypothetical protein ACD_7C00266G0011 [uncultured bacterium]HBR79455.1 hypothetical protein [Candidatus Moranbacteria bacterium]